MHERQLQPRMIPSLILILGLAFLIGADFWAHRAAWKSHTLTDTAVEAQKRHPLPLQLPPAPEIALSDLTPATPQVAKSPTTETPPLPSKNPSDQKPAPGDEFAPIELDSADDLVRLGITLATAQPRNLTSYVESSGVIDYDQTRVVKLSTRVPGTVWRVEKNIGDTVHKGDVLAILEAARVAEAKSMFLQSVVQTRFREATLERLKKVKDVVTQREILEAEAALRESRIKQVNAQQSLANLGLAIPFEVLPETSEQELIRRIHFLGIPDATVANLDPEKTPASLIPVTAPFEGVVTERNLSDGEAVDSSRSLFLVADVSRMWITLQLRKEDIQHVKTGQTLQFFSDAAPGSIQGAVQWISPQVDQRTRTIEVRAEVENPLKTVESTPGEASPQTSQNSAQQRLMQAHTFGRGRIRIQSSDNALAIPETAMQPWNGKSVAFVSPPGSHRFEPRIIKTGIRHDGFIQVLEGIQSGESVVTTGSHILKSALFIRKLQSGGS